MFDLQSQALNRRLATSEVRRESPAIVKHHLGCNSRHRIMQGRCCTTMMSGKAYEHNGLPVHPKHARIIGDERLSITRLMRDSNIPQITREPVINLLLVHGSEHEITRVL